MASGVVAALINAGAALIGYPVYTYFLGLDTYGLWLILATFMQLALLGDLGISHALTKLIAEEHGKSNRTEIQRYLSTAFIILGISGTAILTAIQFATPWLVSLFHLSAPHAKTVSQLLPYMGLLTVYALLCQIYHATLSGLGRMDLANYIQSLGRAGGMIVAAVLVASGRGITGMIFGTAVTCLSTHIAFAWVLWRKDILQILPNKVPQKKHVIKILGFGGGVFSASLMFQALSPFNKLLLCRFCGVASVPIYELAFKCSQQIRSLVEAALRAMMPEVSRISAETENVADRVRHLDKRAFKFMLMLSVPCYLIAFLSIKPLLAIWLGDSLATPLSPVLAIMLLGSFISLMNVPSYYILMGMGQIRSIFAASINQLGTNILGSTVILLFTTSVTPVSIAWCVVLAFSTTTIYLISQKRRLLESIASRCHLHRNINQVTFDAAS